MKITKSQLKQIIREEIQKLDEANRTAAGLAALSLLASPTARAGDYEVHKTSGENPIISYYDPATNVVRAKGGGDSKKIENPYRSDTNYKIVDGAYDIFNSNVKYDDFIDELQQLLRNKNEFVTFIFKKRLGVKYASDNAKKGFADLKDIIRKPILNDEENKILVDFFEFYDWMSAFNQEMLINPKPVIKSSPD